jgi:hypothetical protein
MPYIKVTDNVSGEVKEWEVIDEKPSEIQSKGKAGKAPKKAPDTEQTES